MAFNANAWIPVEIGPEYVGRTVRDAAIEKAGRGVIMNSATKQVPVEGSFQIGVKAKFDAYVEGADTAASVELVARVLGGKDTIAKEDLQDSAQAVIKERAAAGSGNLAVYLDNACFGTTAAANGTTVPFESVYRAVSQYSAGINRIQTAGDLTYADLTSAFGKATASRFFNMSDAVLVADDSMMWNILGMVNSQGTPIFSPNAGLNGFDGKVFGVDVLWTKGARTSATASDSPAGNALLILTTKENLIRGDAKLDGAKTTLPGFKVLTDGDDAFEKEVVKVKVSVRRGFKLAVPAAAVVVEITAS